MENPFELILAKLENIETLEARLHKKISQQPALSRRGGMALAMEVTGYAKATLYKLVSAKEIPHRKKGAMVWFDEEELRKWQDTYKVKTSKEIADEAIQTFKSARR
jgi:predicted DNA-binding transcriptional regulator AlpA